LIIALYSEYIHILYVALFYEKSDNYKKQTDNTDFVNHDCRNLYLG